MFWRSLTLKIGWPRDARILNPKFRMKVAERLSVDVQLQAARRHEKCQLDRRSSCLLVTTVDRALDVFVFAICRVAPQRRSPAPAPLRLANDGGGGGDDAVESAALKQRRRRLSHSTTRQDTQCTNCDYKRAALAAFFDRHNFDCKPSKMGVSLKAKRCGNFAARRRT